MEMQLVVLGAKVFNDSVEGNKYDTTKLLVQLPQKKVNSDTQKTVGYDAVDIPFGTSEEFIKANLARHENDFPMMCELDIEMTTKGYSCNGFKFLYKINMGAPSSSAPQLKQA